jgi:hypothetical protein
MAEDYLTYEQLADQSRRIMESAGNFAIGTATALAGIVGLPEILTAAGLLEVLSSFGAIGAIGGGVAVGGTGLATMVGGDPLSPQQASLIGGLAHPVGAAAAGLAALTGDQSKVRAAVSLTELTFRVVELGNLVSSPLHAPEVSRLGFNILGQPLAEMFMESVEEELRGLERRTLDISVNPVVDNSSNPVTAPGKADQDAAGTIDKAAEPSSGTNTASQGQAQKTDSETDTTSK